MKVLTEGKHLWMRTIGSTIVGQGVDSLIFYPLAFAGNWTSDQVLTVMVTNWLLKVLWEAVLTPVTYADAGVEMRPVVETIVEGAARNLESLAPATEGMGRGPVRWHDPCQLGRGLGVYDEPRAVLTRALGRPPEELSDRRALSLSAIT